VAASKIIRALLVHLRRAIERTVTAYSDGRRPVFRLIPGSLERVPEAARKIIDAQSARGYAVKVCV
jgi:hypothetical protein